MLRRVFNWQNELDKFLATHQKDRFKYGKWDCCLFACDAVRAMTGTDIAAPFRGKYRNREQAIQAIRDYCGVERAGIQTVARRIADENQMEPCLTTYLRRGDVALIKRGARDFSLAIVSLSGTELIAITKDGLQRIRLCEAISGWHV